MIRHVGKVWCGGPSHCLCVCVCVSMVHVQLWSVCLCFCVHVCVEGYSGGHSPDDQISLHSDIPALP